MPRLPLYPLHPIHPTFLHRAAGRSLRIPAPSRFNSRPPQLPAPPSKGLVTSSGRHFTSTSASSPALIPTPKQTHLHRKSFVSSSAPRHRLQANNRDRSWPYLYTPFDKMPHLDPYFKQVDALQNAFIDRLREAVGIPSVSSEDERRPDVVKVNTTPHSYSHPSSQ